jgi:hypothetical protein
MSGCVNNDVFVQIDTGPALAYLITLYELHRLHSKAWEDELVFGRNPLLHILRDLRRIINKSGHD